MRRRFEVRVDGKCTGISLRAIMLLSVAGCSGPMSALDPAGPGAASIAAIWWVMFWGSLAVLALMVVLALYATLRAPERRPQAPTRLLVFGGGIVFPLAVVTVLLVYGLRTGHAVLPTPTDADVFQVEVRAHQWWWEIRYPDVDGSALHDANEIHIPAGRPVDFHISTADVIHAFWVPRLGGKIDAIPGHSNVIRLQADVPGIYRGQCAEFCGGQHARMGILVEAHDEQALQARLARLAQRSRPDPAPHDAGGAGAFAATCAECHSVDARQPTARAGPNLAGVADRHHLGAGTLRNDSDALMMWLLRQQRVKPGNHMPDVSALGEATLAQIAQWLRDAPSDPDSAAADQGNGGE